MCLVQRAVSYHDFGTRLTYDHVKAMLVDPTVTKVVLIGHSQGGIIISQTIDDLLSQLPAKTMSKLEVYTFGSAASHFSNPSLTLTSKPLVNQSCDQACLTDSQSKVYLPDTRQSNHIIPHMEHYANEFDLVPRWGVLHSVQDVLDARYAGSIFVRLGASGLWSHSIHVLSLEILAVSRAGVVLGHVQRVNAVLCRNFANPEVFLGHMFNQHYLDPIFSLSNRQKNAMTGTSNVEWKSWKEVASDDEDSIEENLGETFLDRIVTTDENLAMRRDSTVVAEMGVMRRESGLEFGNGQVLKNCEDANGDGCLTFLRTASDRVVAEEARDKSVRDLSRLWKYLGGKSPMDHDVTRAGYRDEQSLEHRKKRQDYQNQQDDGPVPKQQKSPVSSAAKTRYSHRQVSPMTCKPSM